MAARKLIERGRRKPDVITEDCTPIKLRDGQEWYFPRAWLEIIPDFRDGKAIDHTSRLTFGDELDPLLEAIADAAEPEGQIRDALTLAAFLLRRNYDLEDGDFRKLLTYRAGHPESDEMIKAIINTTLGNLFTAYEVESLRDPKASAVGSGSA